VNVKELKLTYLLKTHDTTSYLVKWYNKSLIYYSGRKEAKVEKYTIVLILNSISSSSKSIINIVIIIKRAH